MQRLRRSFMRSRVRDDATIAAELDAPALRGGQCVLGALGNSLRFMLGHHRHDSHRQPVGVRHVGGDEVDTRLLQAEQEMRVARQAIELGDNKPRPVQAAHRESFRQCWPIGALAALDLGELADDLPVAAIEILRNRSLLRFQP